MRRPAAFFPIVLALGAIILVPGAGAQPTAITTCQTISQPGSYELANNLDFTGPGGSCLVITANFVTIDLAGFVISGGVLGQGISGPQGGTGITVRNGSILGFVNSVNLSQANGSRVEGLRVEGFREGIGIFATGIVRDNIVGAGPTGPGGSGTGIFATGTVTGNVASRVVTGIVVGQGSTVIGNTATGNQTAGIEADCPANLTDNTAVNNGANLVLNGEGCHNEDNVAP